MTAAGASQPGDGTDRTLSPLLDPSERAFWVGLSVVVMSLVAALATYLILTNLTPIVPRNDLVFCRKKPVAKMSRWSSSSGTAR